MRECGAQLGRHLAAEAHSECTMTREVWIMNTLELAMGYCLDAQETVSSGVRRIAREQLDKALECTQPHATSQDEAVHDIRVAFKKLRALLRLVSTKSKDSVLSRENACYRDAGRLLSEVRDTTAILAALDKLIAHVSGQLSRHAFDDVRKPFVKKQRTQRSQQKHAIAEVARMLASARRRVANWPIGSRVSRPRAEADVARIAGRPGR
jgi:CHAD domain-containing protein